MRTVYRTWENSERGHLINLGLGSRIIAKGLLEEQSVNIWRTMCSVAGISECDNEPLNSIPTDDSFFSPSIISDFRLNAHPINSRTFYHILT